MGVKLKGMGRGLEVSRVGFRFGGGIDRVIFRNNGVFRSS